MKTRQQMQGFAMIEVLLAVVVLAIALLAGSRMQILGLNYSQGAMTRSYATMAANDILDRMRLNPAGRATYIGFTTAGTIPADQACAANGCDATGRANQDLRSWAQHFTTGTADAPTTLLPPGTVGTITDVGGTNIIVTITWDELVNGNAETGRQISVGALL